MNIYWAHILSTLYILIHLPLITVLRGSYYEHPVQIRTTRPKMVRDVAQDLEAIIPLLLAKIPHRICKTNSCYNIIFKIAILEISMPGHRKKNC